VIIKEGILWEIYWSNSSKI